MCSFRLEFHDIPPEWDLPEELRPQEDNWGLPTKNLSGCSRSTALSTGTTRGCRRTGVLEGNFGACNQQFQLNKPLLERIGDFVRVADRSVKMGFSVHETANGSVYQVIGSERGIHQHIGFS